MITDLEEILIKKYVGTPQAVSLEEWTHKFSEKLKPFLDENFQYGIKLANELCNVPVTLANDNISKSAKEWQKTINSDSLLIPQNIVGDVEDKIKKAWNDNDIDKIGQDKMAKIVRDSIGSYKKSGVKNSELVTIIRTNRALHQNRGSVLKYKELAKKGIVKALRYDSTLDNGTTFFCREHHGEIISIDDPRIDQMTPPNHYNCRSFWSPILDSNAKITFGKKEFSTKEAREAYGSPAQDFGGVGRVSIGKGVSKAEDKLKKREDQPSNNADIFEKEVKKRFDELPKDKKIIVNIENKAKTKLYMEKGLGLDEDYLKRVIEETSKIAPALTHKLGKIYFTNTPLSSIEGLFSSDILSYFFGNNKVLHEKS